jgi:GWxTD domain-containing protein
MMNKNIFSALFFLFFTVVKIKALDVALSVATFDTPQKPYSELQFHFIGKTMQYKMLQDSLHWQASAEILVVFKQGEKIIQFDKYQLEGPVVASPKNFFDIKRYALEQGDYDLEVSITDVLKRAQVKNFKQKIHVAFEKEKLHQSDIQLLKEFLVDTTNSPLAKNGYIFQTLPFDFYDKNTERLVFYNEVYQADKLANKGELSTTYAIYDERFGTSALPLFTQFKKLRSQPVNILFHQIDISKIASGNYIFAVEIRNQNKELLSQQQVHFQRSNPYLNLVGEGIAQDVLKEEFVEKIVPDTLRYSLKAIACKVSGDESKTINEVIKTNDPQAMRLHLFRYWASKNPNNPEKAYREYMKVARAVDATFRSGFGYGFETDRGYVFMKYGRPNDITPQASSSDAPGFEVWSYNEFPVTKQTNVKFLFWDGDGSGNMRILHSNAIGEVQDKNWKTKLYRNSRKQWTNDGFDPTDVQDNVGRHAGRLLEDF